MSNILIINGAPSAGYAKGELNAAFAQRAHDGFAALGHQIMQTTIQDGYEADEEITKHQQGDLIIWQFPIYWMGLPWIAKKYMDEVYTIGMDGRLASGDGRTSKAPKANYGMGGTLDAKYALSVTL